MFVEAHTVGAGRLPDAAGRSTAHTSEDTGVGCTEDSDFWLSENPFLRRYVMRAEQPAGTGVCSPTARRASGTRPRATPAASRTGQVDLSAYAGKQVELSIIYMTDPRTLGLGRLRRRHEVTADGADDRTRPGSRTVLGGWTVPGAPAGTDANTGDWSRSESIGVVDGPGIRTGHSILWGFGLEGVQGAARRAPRWRGTP